MHPQAISTIIPTYNRAHLLGRALASVVREVLPEDEIIVVDDGSTDDTEGALAPHRGRITYIRTRNAGAGAARNRGVRAATRPLVAFLDSDDEWMPGKLALHRALHAARPEALFSFSDLAITYRDGTEVRRYLKHWHRDPRRWDEILAPGVPFSTLGTLPEGIADFQVHQGGMYELLARALYISTITFVVRREEAGDALRFEEGLPMLEDWLCFGRVAKKGPGAYLDVDTAWQHAHPGDRLTDADDLRRATTRLEILERLWGADPDYLREHGDVYAEVVAAQHRRRAERLVARGRTREARAELDAVERPPLHLRALAALPGPLAWSILGVRSAVKSVFRRR